MKEGERSWAVWNVMMCALIERWRRRRLAVRTDSSPKKNEVAQRWCRFGDEVVSQVWGLDSLFGCVLEVLLQSSLAVADLELDHHALCAQRGGNGLSYGDKEDGEICWEVRNVAHKGSREEGKDAATVDGCDEACFRKRFVEEGLSFGGDLHSVEFAEEDRWFAGDPVSVNQQC